MADVTWHGTTREEELLKRALATNCTCVMQDMVLQSQCAGHRLLSDQKSLDNLLYGLRISHRLLREEWSEVSRAV